MYCAKCGKEIPDGEKKVCEECEKDTMQASEVESVKEEVNAGTQEVSQENTKEKKVKKEKKSKKGKEENDWKVTGEKKKKGVKSVLFVAVLLILIIGGAFVISHLFTRDYSVGNTIGNIRNYGYAVEDGGTIYFLAPNEDSSQIGIFKVKANGKDKELLYMSDLDIVSLNVYKNHIYFIGSGVEPASEDDELDNKIYRMKKDGSELEVLNDNELNNDCYEMYVIDNSIYYIGLNAEICKMDLDGSNKTVIADNKTGYLGINKDYILFNKPASPESAEFITYIMGRDGSNPRPVIEGKRLYSVNIEGNYIYYSDIDKKIYRTEIDSNVEELLYDNLEAYNLNTNNGYAYFLNYFDASKEDFTVCVFKVKLDGSSEQPELIKKLDTYSSFIDIVGKWVIYMDSNENAGFINLVSLDGKEEIVELYHLDYKEYYEKIDSEDYSDVPVDANGEQTTNTVENTAVEATNTVENVENKV